MRRAPWPVATWQPFCPFVNGGRHEENVARSNNFTCRENSILGRRVIRLSLAPQRPLKLEKRPHTTRRRRHGRRGGNRGVQETPRRVCGQSLSLPREARVSVARPNDLRPAVRVFIYVSDVKRFRGRAEWLKFSL